MNIVYSMIYNPTSANHKNLFTDINVVTSLSLYVWLFNRLLIFLPSLKF